jgi:hypothetical protein
LENPVFYRSGGMAYSNSSAACHLYFRQTKSGKKYSAQILGWTLLLDKDILCSRI